MISTPPSTPAGGVMADELDCMRFKLLACFGMVAARKSFSKGAACKVGYSPRRKHFELGDELCFQACAHQAKAERMTARQKARK